MPKRAKTPKPRRPTGGGGVRRSQTRNWEVQRITQKTTTPPGEIRRLSVAVVLNGRYEKRGEKSVFVPRSPDEVLALSSIVKHAVGFNAERGDDVELRAVQFARLDTGDDATAVDPLAKYRHYLPFAAAGLVGVVLLASIIMAWRRSKAKKAAAALALAAPGHHRGSARWPDHRQHGQHDPAGHRPSAHAVARRRAARFRRDPRACARVSREGPGHGRGRAAPLAERRRTGRAAG